MATARSASACRSKPGLAETLATRLPTNTLSEKSSLSEDSVPSTLPRRTLTDCARERTTTASAASAPAFRARSINWLARESRVAESISEDMIWPFLRVPFIVHYIKHQGRPRRFLSECLHAWLFLMTMRCHTACLQKETDDVRA